MRFSAVLMLALAACADWPEAGGPPLARDTRPWPTLMPLDQVMVTAPRAEDAEIGRLQARAAALRARAALLRRDASTGAAMEALRARLSR